MKSSAFLLMNMTLAGVTFISSCSVKDDIENSRLVRFTADIVQATVHAPQSRAADAKWNDGDGIGVFMMKDNAELAGNKHYTVINPLTGEYSPAPDEEPLIFPPDGSPVFFMAYYPYTYEITPDYDIPVEIESVQTSVNQPAYDLLYSKAGPSYNKDMNGSVELIFKHRFSKLVLDIIPPSSLQHSNTGLTDADLAGMKITIKGTTLSGLFNLKEDHLMVGVADDITLRTVEDGSLYDAIILPSEYADGLVEVDFTLTSGQIFTWNVGEVEFLAGHEHVYDITLTRTAVKATGTITPWTKDYRGAVMVQ